MLFAQILIFWKIWCLNHTLIVPKDPKEIFNFSCDIIGPPEESRNTSREEDEAIEINDTSGIEKGMEDVKELKRLLYLAKMKFRKDNPNASDKDFNPKSFKIKRKHRPVRKVKTGYNKKRVNKNVRNK